MQSTFTRDKSPYPDIQPLMLPLHFGFLPHWKFTRHLDLNMQIPPYLLQLACHKIVSISIISISIIG